MQQSLAEILLFDDLESKKKTLLNELRNLDLYRDQMRNFKLILNSEFSLPIITTKYNGKIMYLDFILCRSRLYLSLNCHYTKRGKMKSVESLSQCMVLEKLTDINNIKTLGEKKFRRQIDICNHKNVTVVDTGALMPSASGVKIIENGLEVFAAREKIIKRFSRYFEAQKDANVI